MTDVLFVILGVAHFAALVCAILVYCQHMRLPWREWPLMAFLMLWAALVVTACIISMFDELNSLSSYVIASFPALGLVLLAHRATFAPPLKTPYTQIDCPVFTAITAPKVRRFLWGLLLGTLAVEFGIHLFISFSFYPVNADSLNYRLARVFWYVSHGNLLHPFKSEDNRLTYYPLDGLLLYAPLALYGVSGVFFALPSLFSWLAVSYTTYRFARALQAERLIAVFAMWLVAMTPSILIEASSTNDEILTATPLLIGLFFAWRWLTTGAEHYFFLAALGAGLCVGTKLHVFFLIPIAIMAALWFVWFLWRRHESWRRWIPRVRLGTLLWSCGAFCLLGILFLGINYVSSGKFYFLSESAPKVLNVDGSFQDAIQNFIIYTSSMILAPIADLNFWQSFHQREVTNVELNSYLAPLIAPFVSEDPRYYHLTYKFHGIIIPTSVLLVEYGLWPAFMWLAWPLQAAGLARKKFTLRPFFIVLAATPAVWLVIWSCVTLYMEGVPTYFAFYLMCAAPAMGFCLVKAKTPRTDTWRWWVIGFMVLTNLIIDGNVAVNNTFRGLWHFAENKPWPYDWLLFPRPVIDEIQRAKKIHIAITHGKVYYFAFMHWNPTATYYSPYQPSPPTPDILHILSTPSESMYGFMPLKVPDKPTPGLTYLGHIRGVDREEIFAFGNDVSERHPGESNFISLHSQLQPDGRQIKVTIDPVVAGLNPADQLEFAYEIKTLNKHNVFERPWNANPALTAELPPNSMGAWLITVSVRSAINYEKATSVTFALGGKGAWRINLPGEDPNSNDDDD